MRRTKSLFQSRQIVAVLLIATILVAVAGVLELADAVRRASRQAQVEARLVTGQIERVLGGIARENPRATLAELARDPRVDESLLGALVYGPSIAAVGIFDPRGTAVAHTVPSSLGRSVEEQAPLPDPEDVFAGLRVLRSLGRGPTTYEISTLLVRREQPFASVRIAVPGALLWEAARVSALRSISIAGVVLPLALVTGVLLARVVTRPIRRFEDQVAALREGRLTGPIRDDGIAELSGLAEQLNLLGAQFRAEREEREQQRSGPSEGGSYEEAMVAHLGRITSGLAHELRNQLQTVEFDLRSLLDDGIDEGARRTHLEDASEGVRNLGRVLRGFLKLARVRPLRREPLDPNELLEGIRADLETEATLAGVDLQVETEPDLSTLDADREVLTSAIHNLVRNALQALADTGGTVRLSSSFDEGRVALSVSDDGPGIPDEIRERVFDLYFTTRRDGSGVGLALVQQAAELHGGRVDLWSRPGEGTRIRLLLPVPDAARAMAP